MAQKQLLLLEDDPEDAERVRRRVGSSWQVEHVDHLAHALARLAAPGIDAILTDLHVPDAKGLETVDAFRARCPLLPIVVMTSAFDEARATEALRRGVQDYLFKDQLGQSDLERILRYACERKNAERERDELLGQLRDKVAELETALAKVRVLSGLLPMCAWCKSIRNDEGYFKDVADYISTHSDALVTHVLCPRCLRERYPDLADRVLERCADENDTK
jgi:DNA-binding NtrC family response regulator